MTKIAIPEWRKIRASCAEGSGVAEAIKAYTAKWPADYAKASEKDTGAFLASKKLIDALDVALGKCNSAGPKEDKAKVKATKDLIAEWKTELKKREEDLKIAFTVQQKMLMAEINEGKLVAEVAKNFADVPNQIKTAEDRLGSITKLIATNKAPEAFRVHAQVVFALKNLDKLLCEPGLKTQFDLACTTLKIAAGGTRPADCRPKDFKTWQQKLVAVKKETEKKEAELDQVEDTDDTDSAAGDPKYKVNLKKLAGEYREVQKSVAESIPVVVSIIDQAKRMQAAASALTPDKKPGALNMVEKTQVKVASVETHLATEMAKIRTSSGEVSAKRAQYGILETDTTKFLAPILSKAISLNLRATRMCGEASDLLEAVEQQLKAA